MRMRDRPAPTTLAAIALAWSFASLAVGARRPGLCATAATAGASPAYLAVISAYPAELAPIVAAADVETTIEIGARPYYVGRLGDVRVLLGLTGIGILNATDATEHLLARRDVVGLVMSGTAGTKHDIGDVVIASDLVEPDRPGVFHPNAALVALARRRAAALPEPLDRCTLVPPGSPAAELVCLLTEPVVRFGGRAVSFDSFGETPAACIPGGGEVFGCELPSPALVTAGEVEALHPRSITTSDVEDMESAAVARVAARRRVPFVAVRAGSDGNGDPLGDRGFPLQFFDYYRLAAHNAADVTRALVTELSSLASDPSARRTCRLLARRRWKHAAARIAQIPETASH
jgi:adenosylhomocysteine nucleosidase